MPLTLFATPNPFPTKSFPTLLSLFVIQPLVLDSQSQYGCLLFSSRPPVPPATLCVRIPHSCPTPWLKLLPGALGPSISPLYRCPVHAHPGSSTGTPPDTDLASYCSHGFCTVPLTDGDFGTHAHAHCFYIYPIRACTRSLSILRGRAPTTHRAHRPHLRATRLPRLWS
ncbi:hypothetical protein B0H13DRAFT_2353324 [Mycena leptocephala]|nr:hypothetical protein B0H13DRAFT_2353324 [Mycena leptocephala]